MKKTNDEFAKFAKSRGWTDDEIRAYEDGTLLPAVENPQQDNQTQPDSEFAKFAKERGWTDSEIKSYESKQQQTHPQTPQITGNGLSSVPKTQDFGQQSDYDVFSGNVSPADEWATKPNTPVSAPKGKWEVVGMYDSAQPDTGYIGNFENQGWGNQVTLKNTETGETVGYNHLNSVGVQPGQIVESGSTIGETGHTGNSLGPHIAVTYTDPQGQPGAVSNTPYIPPFGQGIEKPQGVPEGQMAQPQAQPTPNPARVVQLEQNYYAKGTPDEYKPLIDKASKDSGIPTHILSSQIKAESNFDPNAQSAYASGLAQFTPETAQARGVNPSDPASAISGMAAYDREIMDKHGGNTDLALGGYNAGPGAVEDGQLPNYPETLQYVDRINKYAQEATASAKPKTQDLLGKKKPQKPQKNFFQSLLGL